MADTGTDEEAVMSFPENHTDNNHMEVEHIKNDSEQTTDNCHDATTNKTDKEHNDKTKTVNSETERSKSTDEGEKTTDVSTDEREKTADVPVNEKGSDEERDESEQEDEATETAESKTAVDNLPDVETGLRISDGKKTVRSIRRPRDSDLDSDDDTDNNDDEDDNNDDDAKKSDTHSDTRSGTHSESESEEDTDLKPIPRQWNPLSYIRGREIGNGKNMYTYNWGASGSVGFVERLKRQHTLDYHQGCVNTLHFNQKGNLLATGSDDLEIVLWEWARNKPSLIYQSGHKSNVFQAKFMPYSGDTTIVSCARDGQVRVGHLSSTGVCKGTKKIVQHRGAAHKLGLEPDSAVNFLSCGEDSLVYSIDLREDKPTKLVSTKEGDKKVALYSIFINPSNTHEFAVGGRDHFVRVYDRRKIAEEVNDGLLKKFCPQHLVDSDIRANVTCLVYNYNGSEILASYNDEDIYLFDSSHSDGADFIHRYKGHRNNATVKGVNFFGPQSEFVVSGSDCGHVYLWEKTSERIVQFLEGDEGGVVNCLEPHPTVAVLATSGLDHDVKIWAPTAEEATNLEDLKATMRMNRKEREEERRREPDMIDGHMLWYIMHHLRRRARRQQARERGDRDSDDSSSSESEDSDASGESGELSETVQCAPS